VSKLFGKVLNSDGRRQSLRSHATQSPSVYFPPVETQIDKGSQECGAASRLAKCLSPVSGKVEARGKECGPSRVYELEYWQFKETEPSLKPDHVMTSGAQVSFGKSARSLSRMRAAEMQADNIAHTYWDVEARKEKRGVEPGKEVKERRCFSPGGLRYVGASTLCIIRS